MRGDRAKHEKTVVIKNLFEPEMFDREVHLILDYQNDLREECAKCGTVRKVVVYDVSWFFHDNFYLNDIHKFSSRSVIRKVSHKSPWPTRMKPISWYNWWTVASSANAN